MVYSMSSFDSSLPYRIVAISKDGWFYILDYDEEEKFLDQVHEFGWIGYKILKRWTSPHKGIAICLMAWE